MAENQKVGFEVAWSPELDQSAATKSAEKFVKTVNEMVSKKPVTIKLKASGREALVSDIKKKGGNWWTQVQDLNSKSSKAKLTAMRDALALSKNDYQVLATRDAKYSEQRKLLTDQKREYDRYQRMLDQKAARSAKKSDKSNERKASLAYKADSYELGTQKVLERQKARYALTDERAAEKRSQREERLARESAERQEKIKLEVQAKYEAARFMAKRTGRYASGDYDWMAKGLPGSVREQQALVESLKLTEQEETLARMSVRASHLTEEERDQVQEAKDKAKYLKEQEKILAKMQLKQSTGGSNPIKQFMQFMGNTGIGRFVGDVTHRMRTILIRGIARELLNLAKEGLQILTEWDRNFGNNTSHAAETVDHLSARWYELKKSVGAAAMPIIQILMPAIDWVLDKVVGLINIINQFARAIQGYNTYMKATARVVGNTASAAKELKKVVFGFDELNILPSENGSGAVGSVMPYDYDEVAIESKISKTAQFFKDTWAKIKKWWNEHIATPFREIWESIKTDAVNSWEQLKESWGELKAWWKKHISEPIQEAWESIKTDAINAWDQMKESWGEIKVWWNTHITEPVKEAWNSVKTDFNNAVDQMKESWENFKKKWDDVLTRLKQPFVDAFNALKEWIASKPWLAKLLGIDPAEFETTVTIYTDTDISPNTQKLYEILNKADKTFSFEGLHTASDIFQIGTFKMIPKAAGGTVPNTGSLILANESGPEVIANMGNATGIMNTNQMQAAITSGNSVVVSAIYDAVNSVIRTVNNKSTDVYLDGNKVGASVTKYQNNRSKATGQSVLAR